MTHRLFNIHEPVKKQNWLNFFWADCLILLLVLLSGCIATTYEMAELKDDLNKLSVQLNEVQTNQADLSASMDSVNNNMTALSEKLEDTKNRMSLLAQRMDDVQASLTQRIDILTKQLSGSTPAITPPPTNMYQLAYSDYSKGKYDLAIIGFRAYMDKYPGTELATKSQYYLADCYFNKKEFSTALREFDKLITRYPQSEFILSAKYKKALCMFETKKISSGKNLLKSIIKYYPNTKQARQAEEKLKSIFSP